MVPGKIPGMVPGKKNPRKNGPRKIGPRKNVLKKLFSVKRMLGNLIDFIILIDWIQYTHKKMFDVHLTTIHAPNCRTLKKPKEVCCQVLRFYRLITSEHSTHTPRCSTQQLLADCLKKFNKFNLPNFIVDLAVKISLSDFFILFVSIFCIAAKRTKHKWADEKSWLLLTLAEIHNS